MLNNLSVEKDAGGAGTTVLAASVATFIIGTAVYLAIQHKDQDNHYQTTSLTRQAQQEVAGFKRINSGDVASFYSHLGEAPLRITYTDAAGTERTCTATIAENSRIAHPLQPLTGSPDDLAIYQLNNCPPAQP